MPSSDANETSLTSTTLSSKSTAIPLTAMPLIAPSALLQAHLSNKPSIRITGRSPTESRPIDVNIGSLTHCYGSSVVKIGSSTVICGVRAEILPVSEIPNYDPSLSSTGKNHSAVTSPKYDPVALYNLVVPNIDLSTGCSPAHAMNTAPTASNQSLTHKLYSLLLSTKVLSTSQLEVMFTPPPETNYQLDPDDPAYVEEAGQEQVRAYWVLYVDMVCISWDGDGVCFDTAWLSMLAALSDTILPKAWWDDDENVAVCSPDVALGKKLVLSAMPVPLSFGAFESQRSRSGVDNDEEEEAAQNGWLLLDLDVFEEECCYESGCIAIDAARGGKIVKLEKTGGGVLGSEAIKEVLKFARHRGEGWLAILENALRSSRS